MIKQITLSDQDAQKAIDTGDFSGEITAVSPAVILILTQSWCPQWKSMSQSLAGLEDSPETPDTTIFVFEYDRSDLFDDFRVFKESTYHNWEVPYVRMYKHGQFIADGNAMPAGRIMEMLKG